MIEFIEKVLSDYLPIIEGKKEIEETLKKINEFYTFADVIGRDIKNVNYNINDSEFKERCNKLFELLKLSENDSNEIMAILKIMYGINKQGLKIPMISSQEKRFNKLLSEIEMFLDKYDALEQKYSKIYEDLCNKYNVIKDEISTYTKLKDIYIEGKEIIDEDIIFDIYKDKNISKEEKIKILSDIILYNENIEISKIDKISESELRNLLEKENIIDIDIINEIISKYKRSELLEILYKIKVCDLRFSQENLLRILVSGTSANTIYNVYKLHLSNEIVIEEAIEIPEFWTDNDIEKGTTPKRKLTSRDNDQSDDEDEEKEKIDRYKVPSNSIECIKNLNFFRSHGFCGQSIDKFTKAIITPNWIVQMNYDIARLYNFEIAPTVFSASLLAEKYDSLIELGEIDFVKSNISTASSIFPKRLCRIKKCKLSNKLYHNESGGFIGSIYKAGGTSTKKMKQEMGIVEPVISNLDVFDNYLYDGDNLPFEIDKNIFDNEYIKEIEKYRISEYEYSIDGIIISRIKVLRLMSQLVKNEEFDQVECFRYSVLHNVMFIEEELEKVDSKIKEIVNLVKNRNVGDNGGIFI